MDIPTNASVHIWNYAVHPLSPQERARQNQLVIDAYTRLAQNPDFRIVFTDMIETIVLRPSADEKEEGERRLVLRMVTLIREAHLMMQQREG